MCQKSEKEFTDIVIMMSSVIGEKISLVHCFVNSSSTEAGGGLNKTVCTSVCDNMHIV